MRVNELLLYVYWIIEFEFRGYKVEVVGFILVLGREFLLKNGVNIKKVEFSFERDRVLLILCEF